jgi:hypothetical protein
MARSRGRAMPLKEHTMADTLKKIAISSGDGGYVLSIEIEDGNTLQIAATFEQLDLISEEIDRVLDRDEEEVLSED